MKNIGRWWARQDLNLETLDEDGTVIERKSRSYVSIEHADLLPEVPGTKPVLLRLHSDYSEKYPVVYLSFQYALKPSL